MTVQAFEDSIDNMIDKAIPSKKDVFFVNGGRVTLKVFDEAILHDKEVLDKLRNEIESLEKPIEDELNELMKADEIKCYIEADAMYRHLKSLGKQIEEINEIVPESIELMKVDEVRRYIESNAKLRYSKMKKGQLESYYVKL